MSEARTVELTDEQIAFVRESLDYSAQKFRDYDYGPDYEFGQKRRAEKEEMIASVRAALSQASPVQVG